MSAVAVGVTRHKSKELSRKQSQQLELLESELRKEIRDGRLRNVILEKQAFVYCCFCFFVFLVFFFLPLNGGGHGNEKCLCNRRQLNSRVWA